MNITGPDLCEVGETVDFRLTFAEMVPSFYAKVLDPNGVFIHAPVYGMKNNKESVISFHTDSIGYYVVECYEDSEMKKRLTSPRKCFAFDLKKEKFHIEKFYFDLEEIHFILEMKFNAPIIDKVNAQAHHSSSNMSEALQCSCKILPEQSIDVSFHPSCYGTYNIFFFCNRKSVSDPILRTSIIDIAKFKLIHSFQLDRYLASIKKTSTFIFELNEAPFEFLQTWIECPNGNKCNLLLYGEDKDQEIGQARCDFKPQMTGRHVLYAYYGNVLFDKCPLSFFVYDLEMIKVKRIFPGNTYGTSIEKGHEVVLTYDTSLMDQGKLEISAKVRTRSLTDVKLSPIVNQLTEHSCECRILAVHAGLLSINSYYNNEPVKAGCFELSVIKSNDNNEDSEIHGLDQIMDISGSDSMYSDDSVATTEGECSVTVDKKEYGIADEVIIGVSKSSASSSVTVYVINMTSGSEFIPEKLSGIRNNQKDYWTFQPAATGLYQVFLRDVNGSSKIPSVAFLVKDDKASVDNYFPDLTGEGLRYAEVNKMAAFTVDSHGKEGQLTVSVKGPDSIAKCVIKPEPVHGCYDVEYYPKEKGRYLITILWNGKQLPYSPFHVEVIDPSLVKCLTHPTIFQDNDILKLGKNSKIEFDCSEAGCIRMSAEFINEKRNIFVRGTTDVHRKIWKFPMDMKDLLDGTLRVFCNRKLFGETKVKYSESVNKQEEEESGPPQQLLLKGHGLREASVNQEAYFYIDTNSIDAGQLLVDMRRANGQGDDPMVFVDYQTDGMVRCSYTPSTAGDHLLYISWNEGNVKGSPFLVKVWNSDASIDVICSGEGLCQGFIAEVVTIDIDISNVRIKDSTNTSAISVNCLGPNDVSVPCELKQKSQTHYQASFMPTIYGRHQISVMWDRIHVSGSPFYPIYSDKLSLSKVKAFGPGLQSTAFNKFQSNFTVDASDAGVGKLTIQVRGPKEAFQVDVHKETSNSKVVNCIYNPTAKGTYLISIQWNSLPIRGSPFTVDLI